MSSLAKLLKDLGHVVFGSDTEEYYYTNDILEKNNIDYCFFNKENIKSDYVYIISSCYDESNEEVKAIFDNNYEYYYYHNFIEKNFYNKIGVSGTHGKTTTATFLKYLLSDEKVSSLIGDGTGLGIDNYKYFILEACEYKKHILEYNFEYLIVNNIDADHLDYFKDIGEIYDTFKKASEKSKYLIINEDINIEHTNIYKFGKNKNSYCFYEIIMKNEFGYRLKIIIDKNELEINFPFCGEYMIYNFIAALTTYYIITGDLSKIQKKVNEFKLPNRRMNEYIYNNNVIIDDYAHHPTEIKALIDAIKQKHKNKRLIVIFQPHTYSRTLKLKNEFQKCFDDVDILYLIDTFTSKREKYSKSLDMEVKEVFNKFYNFDEKLLVKHLSEEGNVIILLGAGNLDKYLKFII